MSDAHIRSKFPPFDYRIVYLVKVWLGSAVLPSLHAAIYTVKKKGVTVTPKGVSFHWFK